jgi:hypothetical protein
MSRMFVVTVVASFILQAGHITAQTPTDRTAVQNRIVGNEKAVVDAITKNDPKTFHSYILPDSFAMGGEGVMKVADFDKIINQLNADCKVTKFDLAESMFYWVNDSTVVHMYKETVEGTCKGQPIPVTWSSTVWTNKGGKWMAAFHHEAEVTPPAAAPKK